MPTQSLLSSLPSLETMPGISSRSTVPRHLRRRVGPAIDRLARLVGQPRYRVWPAGYVGTVSLSKAELEATLRDAGFQWDPVSLYHYTLVGNSSDGSWVYRSSRLADRQLHVVLFEQGSDRTEIYAHTEFSWIRHPIKHAEEESIRRSEGARTMRRILEECGVAYDRHSIVTRRATQIVGRIRVALRNGHGLF